MYLDYFKISDEIVVNAIDQWVRLQCSPDVKVNYNKKLILIRRQTL